VRDGEVTADTRVVKDDTIEPTGRETAFGGFNSAVAVLAEGERVAVLGQADAPQGGTSYFWTAVSALDRPWRVGLRHETGLRLLRRLQPRWRNYVDAFARLPFAVFFRNSFLICALCTVGQLLSASLAAYAFARLRFPGRDFLFLVLLATLMLPAEVTLIPMFLGYKTLGWVDSFLPIVAPQFCAGAFNVFLLRQFLRTLPRELDEAAMLDGAGCFTIYWRVLMPLARPALIVVGVFTFVWFWKDLMGPLIYLDSMDKRTVALGLESFRNPHEANSHLMMAASALSILPVAALFFLTQRHLLKGIALTGINR
jgi:multiple sugar transport system permease protein